MVQHPLERSQYPTVGDQVEIVKDQNHRLCECSEAGADQRRCLRVESSGGGQITQRAIDGDGTADVQRTQWIEPERLRIVVGVVQRQPGDIPPGSVPHPRRKSERLAVAGSRTEQRERSGRCRSQFLVESWPLEKSGWHSGRCCTQPQQVDQRLRHRMSFPKGMIALRTGAFCRI